MPSIAGVLDPLTIKITQLPNATIVENDWRSFTIDIVAQYRQCVLP
jgi:hypothetical protein